MKKNCILVNSYPNTNSKLEILREQILNLKSLELPILLCSGCEIPQDIIHNVNYVIINKEKIIKSALFQKKRFLENRDYVSAFYKNGTVMFNDNIDLTINKNIKLLFTLAKFFGFSNVMYTEDDNIFINSNDYQKEHFEILNDGKHKICANLSKMDSLDIFHTTHFFANVDFFLENLIFPDSENELSDPNVLTHLRPWSAYEASIYECFRSKLDMIYNIDIKYTSRVIDQTKIFGRDNNISYIINQRVCLMKRLSDNTVCGFINNTSSLINVKIKVWTSLSYFENDNFNKGCWYVTPNLEIGDFLKVEMIDKNGNIYKKEIVYNNEDNILALQLN